MLQLSLPFPKKINKGIDIQPAADGDLVIQFIGDSGFNVDERECRSGQDRRNETIVGVLHLEGKGRGHTKAHGPLGEIGEAECGQMGGEEDCGWRRIGNSPSQVAFDLGPEVTRKADLGSKKECAYRVLNAL